MGDACDSPEEFFSLAGEFQRLGGPAAVLPGSLVGLSGVCVGAWEGMVAVRVSPAALITACPTPPPQAIQHIEGTQERQEQEEEQRRAVIVKPARSCPEAHASDTASDSEASDSDAMDQSREEPAGNGGLP